MKNLAKALMGVSMLLLIIMIFNSSASAIPTFARKYKTSCSTCHVAPPFLNSFGIAFRLNGYRFPVDDESLVKSEPIKMGREIHKEIRDMIWPSSIPELPPIAIRFFGDVEFTPDQPATATHKARELNFNSPNFWRILSAGTLDEKLSWLLTICFKSDDKVDKTIPFQAEIVYTDIFSDNIGEDLLNLRFGLIDIRNLGWNNYFQHLTISNYLYGSTPVPAATGISDGNDFQFLSPGGSPGFELYGLLANKRLYWETAVNNGDDMGAQDDNSEKDAQVILRYKIGGIPYGGEGVETSGTNNEGSFWNKSSLQIGGLYYYGSAEVKTPAAPATTTVTLPILPVAAVAATQSTDRFWRVGWDIRFDYDMDENAKGGAWSLRGGGLYGNNDDPWGTLSASDADFDSHYVEGIYMIYRWLIPGLRYESVHWDLPGDITVPSVDQNRVVPSLTIRARQNFKLTFEANIYTKNDKFAKPHFGDTYLFRYDLAI